MAEESADPKKEPERIWMGSDEIGGKKGTWRVVDSGGKRYLQRGSEFREVKQEKVGGKWIATEIEGEGKIERYNGKAWRVGDKKVEGGDIGQLLDQ